MFVNNWVLFKLRNNLYPYLRKKIGVRSLTHTKNKYKRKIDKFIYTRQYFPLDLEVKLRSMGIKEGDVVCIHSSWDEFYNFKGTPEDFINIFIRILGSEGTLLMPSYPLLRNKDSIFNIKTTPTRAGLIPEVFRHFKDIERSLDIHSVAVWGKHAKFLTESHLFSETSWDQNSPYYKLGELKAKVLNFGLGKYHVGTIMHCADSILRKEIPYFKLFFGQTKQIKIKKINGEFVIKNYLANDDDFSYFFTEKSHWKVIKNNFDKSKYKLDRISNLKITLFDAEYTLNKSVELAKKGIVVYLFPNPNDYEF
jgi:aminoglycoside 3-N-acetyltransferase